MKAGYVLLQDRLKGEYKDAFQKVQMYSTSNLIGEDTESELMMELLDHMLMAQEEGKPVFHQCAGVGCSYASDRLHRRILYRKCSYEL